MRSGELTWQDGEHIGFQYFNGICTNFECITCLYILTGVAYLNSIISNILFGLKMKIMIDRNLPEKLKFKQCSISLK